MPTYDNPDTDVVHWVDKQTIWPTPTACLFLSVLPESKGYDPDGSPAAVTCCHCRGTASWLAVAQKESELVRKYDALLREEPT